MCVAHAAAESQKQITTRGAKARSRSQASRTPAEKGSAGPPRVSGATHDSTVPIGEMKLRCIAGHRCREGAWRVGCRERRQTHADLPQTAPFPVCRSLWHTRGVFTRSTCRRAHIGAARTAHDDLHDDVDVPPDEVRVADSSNCCGHRAEHVTAVTRAFKQRGVNGDSVRWSQGEIHDDSSKRQE